MPTPRPFRSTMSKLLGTAIIAALLATVTATVAGAAEYETDEKWSFVISIKHDKHGHCLDASWYKRAPVEGDLCYGDPVWQKRNVPAAFGFQLRPAYIDYWGRLHTADLCLGVTKNDNDKHVAHLWQCENYNTKINDTQIWREWSSPWGKRLYNVGHRKCLELSDYRVAEQARLEDCRYFRQDQAFDITYR